MADEQVVQQAVPVNPQQDGGDYGYQSDEVKGSNLNFGLNTGNVFMTKFEYIINAGKGSTEGEALDIVFNVNGTEKSFRRFPVTQAFGPNNEVITDRSHAEFKKALSDYNAVNTHILHAFIDEDTLKAKLSRRFVDFKEFAQYLMTILPANFAEIPLDLFLQFQFQPSKGQDKTYLDIPTKMNNGRWLGKAIPGNWVENKIENAADNKEALFYTNERGEKHPFVRNGWFIKSNFANQQRPQGSNNSISANVTTSNAPLPSAGTGTASSW